MAAFSLDLKAVAAFFLMVLVLSPLPANGQVDTSAGDALIGAIQNHCCLSKFRYALQISRVESRLRDAVNTGRATVLAPTDDVVNGIEPGLWKCLTTGQGPLDLLSQIMLFHIVTEGNYTAEELRTKKQVTSASGMPIDVAATPDGKIILENYAVVTGASVIVTPNATLHTLGDVLVPETILGPLESLCTHPPPSASAPSPSV